MRDTQQRRFPWFRATWIAPAMVAAVSIGAGLGDALGPAERPNVVLIVADDLGFMDIAANNPDTFHLTPNLSRLAAMGVRFTNGYAAAPVCSPTRACLLTGKTPARLGITNVIHTRPNVAKAMRPAPNREQLEQDEVTLAEAFRLAGYRTFFSGKWHLGGGESIPSNHGFEAGLVRKEQMAFPSDSAALPQAVDPKQSDRIAAAAVRFIDAAGSGPFFAYLPFPAPHLPLQAPRELVKKYELRIAETAEPKPATANPVYAAMIEQLDGAVGRILDAIDRRGITDRTIIVFTSDNGGLEAFATSNAPLRAGKGTLYEGGIRVPLIVVAPGLSSPGRVSEAPASTADLYPTLLELAGLPPRPRQHRDGTSLVPALRGEAIGERSLCWHFPHYSVGPPASAIRQGDWKLIEWFEDGRLELFNLRTDIGEAVDLVDREPGRARSLHASLAAWRTEVGGLMPTVNDAWNGTEEQ